MKFWQNFRLIILKYKIFLLILFYLAFSFWLEFRIFDFSFLSISEKNVLLFFLFHINLIFILILLYFIFRYLLKIFWELQIKKISKSIKVKLFIIYFVSILFPSLILVLGSFLFFKKTLNYWVREFFEEKIISQFMKAQDYYKEVERDLLVKGQKIIKDYISKTEIIKSKVLREKYRYFYGLDSIEVFTFSGELYKKTYSSEISNKLGIPPSLLEKIIKENRPQTQISVIDSKSLVRVFIPCKDKYQRGLILSLGKILNFQKLVEVSTYPEKKYFNLFKKFLLMAGISTVLLITFVGIWIGSKLGRNLTEPLRNLVLATQKISKKDYELNDFPLTSISQDEIGTLVNSFKEMAQKLKEYEEEMKRYNEYLISILNHLPVGILIINTKFQIKYLNESLKTFIKIYQFKDIEELLNYLNISKYLHAIEEEAPFYKIFEFKKDEKEIFIGLTIFQLKLFKEENLMLILENLEEKENLKKLSIWKEVALRIAHEIKNPLTPIKLSIERIKKKVENNLDEETKKLFVRTTEIIEKYIEELRKLAEDFYYFSKKSSLNLEKGSLLENLIEVVNLYELAYPEIKFVIKAEDDGECVFDKFQFKRVWINLIDNAIKAIKDKGEVKIFLSREDNYILIKIFDTGKGIPSEIKDRINQGDFIKLKELGTGLLMAYSIIQSHKGTLEVGEAEPKGTCFTIKIPYLQI